MRKQTYLEPLVEVANIGLESGIAISGETVIMDGGEGFDLGFLEDETLF
jgi:hypothetical protein